MNGLKDLQEKFQDYLLHSNTQIAPCIISTKNVPVELRLSIYRHAYQARLLEALEASYPILLAYMGNEGFYSLGQEYLSQCPSSYRSIRWFGDQLPAFLQECTQHSDRSLLSELATVEWTMALAFDAADSGVMSVDEMASLPPDAWITLRCQLHPSVHHLRLSWNVVPLWQALSQKQTPPGLEQSQSPINWVIWRKDLVNQFCSLTEEEAWVMEAMAKGTSFGQICEGLCQWADEQNAVIRAASLLKNWTLSGLIRR